jgi:hypothetical protein
VLTWKFGKNVLSIYQKSLSLGVSNWRLSKLQKKCTHHRAVAHQQRKTINGANMTE